MAEPNLYGFVAEYEEPEGVIAAARRVTEAGYRHAEAYSPYPMEGLAEALGFTRTGIPWITLIGGIVGGTGGFALQYWVSVIAYPLNVGGRPLNSWPMFMPVTFECTILVAALFCVLGMLALNGLPRPFHPLFEVDGFERATSDRFFLFIPARDPQFDPVETRKLLESLQPTRVSDVPGL